MEQIIDAINAALKGKPGEKMVQQKLSQARKNREPNLRKYPMQESLLGSVAATQRPTPMPPSP